MKKTLIGIIFSAGLIQYLFNNTTIKNYITSKEIDKGAYFNCMYNEGTSIPQEFHNYLENHLQNKFSLDLKSPQELLNLLDKQNEILNISCDLYARHKYTNQEKHYN